MAIELAARRQAPILSVDSMQVYKGMDIGTAKPTAEEQARVPHLMIDLVEPEVEFSVARFQTTARDLMNRHPEVFIVGGSGLHFRSVVDPLNFPPSDESLRERLERVEDPVTALVGADPGATEIVDIKNRRRVLRALEIFHLTGETPTSRSRHPQRSAVERYEALYEFRAVGLDPGARIGERISRRVDSMRAAGLEEEVRRLRHRLGRTASRAVGYRQLIKAMNGEISAKESWAAIKQATLAVARRQRTYFRRDPRIEWQTWDDDFNGRVAAAALALGI